MNVLESISTVAVYAAFALTALAGILAVTVRNIFHAALGLVFALLGVAVTYFILQAEFLAAIQILLYVGAIMTLIIFAVMLTSRIGDQTIPTSNRQRYPVAIGILLFILMLFRLTGKVTWPLKESLTTVDAVEIGRQFMGPYVFPFEVVSVVLVAALIGAVVIAKAD